MRHNESRLNVVGVATGVQRVPPSWLLLYTATALATLGSPPTPAASVVEFSAARYAVVESSSTLSITVKRHDGLDSAASVDYFTADSSGRAGRDYVSQSGTLEFEPGEALETITLHLLVNNAVRQDTTFTVTLTRPSNGTVLGPVSSVKVLVQEAGSAATGSGARIGFAAPFLSVAEGPGTIFLTVERSGDLAGPSEVLLTISGGTATPGIDFSPPPEQIVFAPFEAAHDVAIPILDDGLIEGDETVVLTLKGPSVSAGGVATATLTIADNEAPGVLDQGFHPGVVAKGFFPNGAIDPGDVYTIALQPDDKVLMGGVFQSVSGQPRRGLARLNPDGSLDHGFDPTPGVSLDLDGASVVNPSVNALVSQPDGKVIIAGFFSAVNGARRNSVARLQADGSLDQAFDPGGALPAGAGPPMLNWLAVDSGGKILAGGSSRSANGLPPRSLLVRFQGDGAPDQTFQAALPANGALITGAIQADGKVLVALDVTGRSSEEALLRLQPDGQVDASFQPGAIVHERPSETKLGYIRTILPLSDGKVLVGGWFTTVQGLRRNGVARLNPDGSLDATFDPGSGVMNGRGESSVSTMALQPDGRIWIGGDFITVAGLERPGIARLQADGSLDADFALGQGVGGLCPGCFVVRTAVPQPDQKLLLGGFFATVEGQARPGIARLNAGTYSASLLEFEKPVFNVSEDDLWGLVQVRRFGILTNTVSVEFAATDGTAAAGSDYVPLQGTLRFDPFQTNRQFVVSILNDSMREPGEWVRLSLSNPSPGAALYRGEAQLLIADSFSLLSYAQTRQPVPEESGRVLLTVQRGGATNTLVTVAYGTEDGTAGAGVDYVETKGVLNFTPGETSKSIAIPILNDFDREENESFRVILSAAGGKAEFIAARAATVTIEDNDTGFEFTFGHDRFRVEEGSGPIGVAVRRGTDLGTPVSVDYTTRNGSALAGEDFIPVSGTLTFAAGEAEKSFLVVIANDASHEETESFSIELSNPSPGTALGLRSSIQVEVFDNEPIVQFNNDSFWVGENDKAVTLLVTRDRGLNSAVTVDFTTLDGSARSGSDYTPTSGTLFFAPGDTARPITIALLDDTDAELPETFQVLLDRPTGGAALGFPSSATVTMQDDEVARTTFNFEAATFTVSELEGMATITVVRSEPAIGCVQVRYSTGPGTATPGLDYQPADGALYFQSGQSQARFSIPITEDALPENDEAVILQLHHPSSDCGVSVRLGEGSTALLTILNGGNAVEFAAPLATYFETNRLATIHVRRRGETNLPFTVRYSTRDSTALAGKDYLAQSGTLSFAAGQLSTTITVPLLDNYSVEGTRLAELALSDPADGAVLTPRSTATLAILDDERPVVLDPSFTSVLTPDSSVNAMALQPDGKIVLGGHLRLGPERAFRKLLRINADGSLDPTFNEYAPDGSRFVQVNALSLDPSGRILVVGVHSKAPELVNAFRCLSDGSLDAAFEEGLAAYQLRFLHRPSIVSRSNGQSIVVGEYDADHPRPWPGLIRLSADGSLDSTFRPGSGARAAHPWAPSRLFGSVSAMAVTPDGKLVIGGKFRTYDGSPRSGIARLNADGSLDPSFDSEASVALGYPDELSVPAEVQALGLQTDGRILIGGRFHRVNGVERPLLARLNADGSLDESFDAGLTGGQVGVLTLQPDGKIVVGGLSLQARGLAVGGLFRLHPDGSLDGTLASTVEGVTSIQLQPDGNLVMAGPFSSVQGFPSAHVARLFGDTTSRLAVEFSAPGYVVSEDATNAVLSIFRGGDSRRLISVRYTAANGTATAGADYSSDGSGVLTLAAGENAKELALPIFDDGFVESPESFQITLHTPDEGVMLGPLSRARVDILDNEIPAVLDTGFDPVINGPVTAVALQSDGKLVVGGRFDQVSGFDRFGIARLNPDGTVDASFAPQLALDNGAECCPNTRVLAVQPDGRILLGGDFFFVNGVRQYGLARLDADGSLDTTFTPALEIGRSILAVVLQTNGSLLVGGDWGLTRLKSDGSPDSSFQAQDAFDNGVSFLSQQSDGGILVGGWFDAVYGIPRHRVARLNADGSLDPSYVPIEMDPMSEAPLERVLAIQPDGRIILAGYDGLGEFWVRLNPDGSLDGSFHRSATLEPLGWRYTSSMNVASLPGGNLFVLGNGSTPAGEFNQVRLARFNSDGTPDPGFTPVELEFAYAGRLASAIILPRSESTLVIAGDIAAVSGRPGRYLASLDIEQASRTSCELARRDSAASESEGEAAILVRRLGDTSQATAVQYSAVGGSAVAGEHFIAASGTLTFAPLEVEKTFTVTLLDNAAFDEDRVVHLALSEPSDGVALGRSHAALKLLDDDRPWSIDFSFDPELHIAPEWGSVDRVLLLPSGQVGVWGNFDVVVGVGSGYAVLNPDGTLGQVSTPIPGQPLAFQPDGKSYSYWNDLLVRFNPDGAVDSTFALGITPATSTLQSIAVLPDGRLLVGGPFAYTLSGPDLRGVARLHPDGSVDPTFRIDGRIEDASGGTPGEVRCIAIQPDGKILIGGYFSLVDGVERDGLARLHADGTIDLGFAPLERGRGTTRSLVSSIAVGPDGQILVLGNFPQIDSSGLDSVLELDSGGTLITLIDFGSGPAVDSPWCDRCPGHLSSMALQPDGTLLLAGNFTHFNDVPRAGLVRLDSMPRPVIASATRTADGRFLITVRGKPAQPYQIEFSTDLVTWTLLREVFSSGAMVEITDREASLLGHGFYRVRHR